MSSSAVSDDADPPPSSGEGDRATIPVICGPTASGKSAIAFWLSQRWPVTIISADSRQVYRGFDVGTAKPSAAERARVPHRGIDMVDPTERFSAADFAEVAHAAIREALAENRVPLVVGGTGFYIASLFRPLWEQPLLDADRRMAVQRELEGLSVDELRRWCASLDPQRAHLGRAQLLRSIEIALLTGERLSDMHVTRARPGKAGREGRWRPSYLLVDPGSELHARIVARASAMFEAGWTDEVGRLMDTVPEDAPAWNATGYDVVRELARGAIDSDAALERVVIETRQYAKRQRTWFRHQLKDEPLRRLSPLESGWQEKVDRWITEVKGEMSASMKPSPESAV